MEKPGTEFRLPVSILFQFGFCFGGFSWVLVGYHKVANFLFVFVITYQSRDYENGTMEFITRRSQVQIRPPLVSFALTNGCLLCILD